MEIDPRETEQIIAQAILAARDTRALLVEPGALREAAGVFQSQFGTSPAVVVADVNTFAAAGRRVVDAFKLAGNKCREPFVFNDPALYAEHGYVSELQQFLAQHEAIPIAVGSGSLNDITKLAARRVGRPYMCVATAASMDGYTAFGASITHEGSKQTFDCPAPRAVVADLDVICAAPSRMNAWGYADLLAKMTAGADWIVADELGVEPIDPQAWRMVQERLRQWTGNPDGVARADPDAIRNLVCGLMMSGFAMQATCSSRPASGAEHQFSHLWDMQHATGASHGAKVGVATLAVAKLYEALLKSPLNLDVDSLVAKWRQISEVEAQIDDLFDLPELKAKAKLETRAKHPLGAQLQQQIEMFLHQWPHLRRRISEHLLPSTEMSQMLSAAGAPNGPEQIGISPEQMRQSFRQAYHIRRRFTVLDLAVRTGTLDACLDDIFL